jgi:DNA/RNA-binding domain of Phe-tRNA-synthetase-like protein
MELIVAPEIFARFPDMRIVGVVADEIDNRVDRPAVNERWTAVWDGAAAAAQFGNAQSHPRVVPWRERFRAMGVSPKEFPSSIEALLRRALKGGVPFSINPLVDFYNAVSLRHVVPAGGFDLDHVDGSLEMRLTREGDTFTGLDAGSALMVAPGEIAYATGSTVLTRHFVWRQSREALITPDTRRAVLLAEVLGEVGEETAQAVLDEFGAGLAAIFGVASAPFVASAETPAVHATA